METSTDSHEFDKRFNKYALGCVIVASTISIVFGYDTGVMSGAMLYIKEDLKISDVQVEVLAGILNLCALAGALAAGRTSDLIGRRYTFVLAAALFTAGAVLMGYGPSYAVLMAGRCTAGVGVGFALLIAPVYSAEISSPATRGFLTSLPELCISFGILLGYVSNFLFSRLPLRLGWRLMLGVAAAPSLALALGILKMPESPRWLVLRGRLGEAESILLRISNTKHEAAKRLRDIKVAAGIDENARNDDENFFVISGSSTGGAGVWRDLLVHPTPPVRWILIAAVGIHFFQHATGIEAVILYSPRIFTKAGVTHKDKLLLATIGVGVTKTVFILISTFLLDRLGRRRLLLTGVAGMVLAHLTLGFSLTVAERSKNEVNWALVLSIITVYVFVGFYSIGLGPITWVYSTEIFPLKLRAQGASIGVAVNRIMNATVSMSFISIYEAITIGGSFFVFAGAAVVAWAFFYFFLPETKGVSLEDMEVLFSKGGRERFKECGPLGRGEAHDDNA